MRILAHAHSDWSHDGRIPLEAWPRLAREAGADMVWLTEHEESGWSADRYAAYRAACDANSTPAVRLIPGIEFLQDGQHVLCYGLREWPDRPGSAMALASAVNAQGRFLTLAHPGKYGWRPAPGLLDAVDAVEVWNSKWIYDGRLGPHGSSVALLEQRLPMAGQDVHARKHLSPLLIEVDGAPSDPIAVVRAGTYRLVCGSRHWTPESIRGERLRARIQQVRTPMLRRALGVYRWLKRRGVRSPRPQPASRGATTS